MSEENKRNQVVWVDIPVVDLDRAIKFYSAVLGREVQKHAMGEWSMGVLPHEGGNGGCLVVMKESAPSRQGVLIYLNAEGRLEEAEAAVAPNGGQVLETKHQIGPYGYRAVVLDSEGNRIALHSR